MSTSETINFHFLFICFLFYFTPRNLNLLKVMFKLWWIAFALPQKSYRIGLLFIHKNGWGGLISVCDGAKLRLGSDL